MTKRVTRIKKASNSRIHKTLALSNFETSISYDKPVQMQTSYSKLQQKDIVDFVLAILTYQNGSYEFHMVLYMVLNGSYANLGC